MIAALLEADERATELTPSGAVLAAALQAAAGLLLLLLLRLHPESVGSVAACAAALAIVAGATWGSAGGAIAGILIAGIPLAAAHRFAGPPLVLLLHAAGIVASATAAGFVRHHLRADRLRHEARFTQERNTIQTLLVEAAQAEEKALSLEARLQTERRLTAAVTRLQDASPDAVPVRIAESTRQAVGKGRAVLYREIEGGASPAVVTSSDATDAPSACREFVPVVLKSNRPLIVRDTTRLRPTRAAVSREAGSFIAVVMRTSDGARGVLSVESDAANSFDIEDLRLLENFSGPSSVTLQQADTYHEMKRRALHDALTGLLRRDAYERRFESDIRRAMRYGHCVSLLMIDLDRFKILNDTYGHQAGDDALCRVAAILRECAPAGSHIGRVGGEEFAVSFMSNDPSDAGAVADRIRTSISCGVSRPDGTPLTVSIGVAICPLHAQKSELLLKAADAALYRAKAAGRNRVEASAAPRYEAEAAV